MDKGSTIIVMVSKMERDSQEEIVIQTDTEVISMFEGLLDMVAITDKGSRIR
jgi:hypothetical protein